jgi:hypothetical protein
VLAAVLAAAEPWRRRKAALSGRRWRSLSNQYMAQFEACTSLGNAGKTVEKDGKTVEKGEKTGKKMGKLWKKVRKLGKRWEN